MSILWVGVEELSFPYPCGNFNYNDNWVRYFYNSNSTNVFRLANTTFTPQTSLWMRYAARGTAGTYYHCGVFDQATGYGIFTSIDASYTIAVSKWEGSKTQFAIESGSSFDGSATIDMQIVNYGASGTIRVWVENVKVIDYTGDISVSGVSGFNCFGMAGREGSTSDLGFSQMIVATESTRNMFVKTLAPNAAGDANDWTGAYTDIDETVASDADNLYTSSVGQEAQFNLTGMPTVDGDFEVRAVAVAARISKGSGNLDAKIGVKTNSAIHLGSPLGIVDGYFHYEYFTETNPETASAFTTGEIDALQIAVQSVGVSSTTTTTSTTSTTV